MSAKVNLSAESRKPTTTEEPRKRFDEIGEYMFDPELAHLKHEALFFFLEHFRFSPPSLDLPKRLKMYMPAILPMVEYFNLLSRVPANTEERRNRIDEIGIYVPANTEERRGRIDEIGISLFDPEIAYTHCEALIFLLEHFEFDPPDLTTLQHLSKYTPVMAMLLEYFQLLALEKESPN